WDDPWDDEPGDENPLTAFGVPDVGWPAAYRRGPLERRRSAAELVLLAGAAAADSPPSDPVWAAETAAWDREVGQLLDELAAARAPVRDVLLPRTLSASQVVALAQDAEEFARALARPMPRRPSTAARRGTAFHAWVEHLSDAKPLFDTEDLEGAADDEWPDDIQAPEDELAELQAAFAKTPYGDLTPYAVEAPFELVIGGRLLRGRIDAVYRTEAGFDVVDYKTGLRPGKPAAVALQLAIYRLAWAGIAGVPVESVGAAFLYVRTGDLVRPELATAADIAALLSDGEPAAEVALPSPPALDAASVATALAAPSEPLPVQAEQDEGQLALDWS
ncbi:MAG: ATP-dependent helicase UvrD/PcrA, partial [Frankiales bacterium]|nr:ATP-dependent helicase UvrD/PcrA [Frankiales bacterium]